ncbi:hypothetical protein EAH87_11625 [Sphingomonas koreensis]|nr:hypothetical protein EAH87_11625 [Sphingomonas koreensis]
MSKTRHGFYPFLLVIGVVSCSPMGRFSPSAVFGRTHALHLAQAIEKNDIAAVYDNRAYVNVIGKFELTPLLWAVKREAVSAETASTLIELGSDPFVFSKTQLSSPAEYAVTWKTDEYFKTFIDNIHNIDGFTGRAEKPTMLFVAIVDRNQEKVRLLISRGANLDYRNSDGDTPLLFAMANQFNIAIDLIAAGANVRAANEKGLGVCSLFSTPMANLNDEALRYRASLIALLSARGVRCPADR